MKIEALLPYLLPDVPGVPDFTAKQALLLSAIEFCIKTHAWDEIQDPFPLIDKVSEYDIDVVQGAAVAAIKNVWAADRRLEPVTMEELVGRIPNWQAATSTLPTFYNAPADLSVLRVYPIPDLSNGALLTVRVAFTPTLASTTVPDSVINRYLEPILSGAKHRLMVAPGKGWSNAALATYHQEKFDDGVQTAKIDVLHDKVQGSVRVKPIRFGV